MKKQHKYDSYILLQALFSLLICSFLIANLLLSSHRIENQFLQTQANAQLQLYKQSLLLLIRKSLAQGILIPQTSPISFDSTNSLIAAQIQPPYTFRFNVLQLNQNYTCIEVYLSVTTPDGTLLQDYDSFLLRQNTLIAPKLQCNISLMP